MNWKRIGERFFFLWPDLAAKGGKIYGEILVATRSDNTTLLGIITQEHISSFYYSRTIHHSHTHLHTKTDRQREGKRCCYLVVGIFFNRCVVVRNR